MSTPKDDIEAVRTVIEAIKDFQPEEQQRIFRWAAEKLNLPQPFVAQSNAPSPAANLPTEGAGPVTVVHPPQPATGAVDIKSFIALKRPRSDVQFAAAVAYYYRFESSQAERKEAIDKEVLQDATRRAGRDRFSNPGTTLNNAHKLGLLDRGTEKGTFTINTVGENLVAMTLPDGTESAKPSKTRAKRTANTRSPRKEKKA